MSSVRDWLDSANKVLDTSLDLVDDITGKKAKTTATATPAKTQAQATTSTTPAKPFWQSTPFVIGSAVVAVIVLFLAFRK